MIYGLYYVRQCWKAERCGADIITVTNDLLAKLGNVGKDLEQFTLETVQMFESDGRSIGFPIKDR